MMLSFTQDGGKSIPSFSCNGLTGKTASFPKCLKGKYSILGFAMSSKAEEGLKSWFKPVFYAFIYKPEKAVLFRTEYDVNLYFIPMFETANKAGYAKSKAKLNVGLDKNRHTEDWIE